VKEEKDFGVVVVVFFRNVVGIVGGGVGWVVAVGIRSGLEMVVKDSVDLVVEVDKGRRDRMPLRIDCVIGIIVVVVCFDCNVVKNFVV